LSLKLSTLCALFSLEIWPNFYLAFRAPLAFFLEAYLHKIKDRATEMKNACKNFKFLVSRFLLIFKKVIAFYYIWLKTCAINLWKRQMDCILGLDTLAHDWISATWEVKIGELQFEVGPSQNVIPYLKNY
jgi:hypothetical protein